MRAKVTSAGAKVISARAELVGARADCGVVNSEGETALHHLGSGGDVVALLVGAKADPGAQTPDGNTALHNTEHEGVVASLMAAKAPVSVVDRWGQTPVHHAAWVGRQGGV